MKRKFRSIPGILMLTMMAACGPAPEPALSSADLANTAIADAWIAVTQTQAAIPTNTATPIPLTPTALPTFTPFPTLSAASPTSAPVAAATDTCNQVPPLKPKGGLAQVKLINKSGGNANLSLGMNSPNSQGECITYTFTLGTYDEVVQTVLAGCYWGYAWIAGSEPSTAQTINLLCLTDPNKAPAVWISKEVIAFH